MGNLFENENNPQQQNPQQDPLNSAFAVFDDYEKSWLRWNRQKNLDYIAKLKKRKANLLNRKELYNLLLEVGNVKVIFEEDKTKPLKAFARKILEEKNKKIPPELRFPTDAQYQTHFPLWTIGLRQQHFVDLLCEFYIDLLEIYQATQPFMYMKDELAALPIFQQAIQSAQREATEQPESGARELARNTMLCGLKYLGQPTAEAASKMSQSRFHDIIKKQLKETNPELQDKTAEIFTTHLMMHGIADLLNATGNFLLNETIKTAAGHACASLILGPSSSEAEPLSYGWEGNSLVAYANMDCYALVDNETDPPTYYSYDKEQAVYRQFSNLSDEKNEAILHGYPPDSPRAVRKERLPLINLQMKMSLNVVDGKIVAAYPSCSINVLHTGLRHVAAKPPAPQDAQQAQATQDAQDAAPKPSA